MGHTRRTIWLLVALGTAWVIGLGAFLSANEAAPAQTRHLDPVQVAGAVTKTLPHRQPLAFDRICTVAVERDPLTGC
jgi:hypothetical protein